MSAEHRFDVTLPAEMVQAVETMVRSGAYASVNEAVQEGLRTLLEHGADLERWLQKDVVEGHAEYMADPSKAVPASDVLKRIRARRSRQET